MRQAELPARLVVMGVSGSGKSSFARLLAERLGFDYVEGDDDHPPENIAKMEAGKPLTDADRQAWLVVLKERIRHAASDERPLVLTCSALKRRYRDLLREGDPDLLFVHLYGDRDLIASRMAVRSGHFMPSSLLDSQLRDLEPPGEDERAIRIDVKYPLAEMVDEALRQLRQE